MLRSFRDRLLIALYPSGLALVRLAGRLRTRIVAQRIVACDSAHGSPPWHGVVAALNSVLDNARNDPLDVTVVLSNHFVRYAILPWSDALSGAEEEDAFARHHFTRIYGERAKSWALRTGNARAGVPRPASAIDAGLYEAIRGCFQVNGRVRLVSVQPYLMAAFNCWRHLIPPGGAWLLVAEEDRACAALYQKGRWRAVQNSRGAIASPGDWAALLDRERHRIGGPVPELVLVRAAREWDGPRPAPAGWEFRVLSFPAIGGFAAVEDERYGAALAVA